MHAICYGWLSMSIVSYMNGDSSAVERMRLLAVAEELFGTRSYEKTRVQDLAAAAGLATGSFYRFFPSKRDLLVELLRSLSRELRAEMRSAIKDATSQREVERGGFEAFFGFLSRHPHLFQIQRQVEFVAPEVYREYFEELALRYARGAKEAMVEGEVDPRFDPEFLAYAYMGLAHFVGMRWVEWTRGGRVPQEVMDQVLLLLEKALRPEVANEPVGTSPSGEKKPDERRRS